MNVKLVSTAISLLCTASLYAAGANAYQFEVRAGYQDGSEDVDGDSEDIEGFDLGFSVYFPAVDDSEGPLAEAAFLQRASSFSVDYLENEEGGEDRTFTRYQGDIVDAKSGVIGGLTVSTEEVGSNETLRYQISMGKYLFENTTAVINLARADLDKDLVGEGGEDALESAELRLRHVHVGSFSFAAEAHIGVTEVNFFDDVDMEFDKGNQDTYGAALTLYPTNDLGVGIFFDDQDGYQDMDGEAGEQTQGISAEYFIMPTLAVSLSYTETENGDDDGDAIAIGVRGRF